MANRLAAPVVVLLPWQRGARHLPDEVAIPVGRLRRPASVLAAVLPVAMMLVGAVIAIPAAHLAQRDGWEAEGTLLTEAGAAIWFAGAVTWGARRGATVARLLLLLGTLLGGLFLIVTALLDDWTGAGLDLAMEFGVGLVAVAVLDVVLLGVVQGGLESTARLGRDDVRILRIGQSWHLLDVERFPESGAVE